MAVKPISQLRQGAVAIRDEVKASANTSTRVGTSMLDIIDTLSADSQGYPPYIGEDGFWYAWDVGVSEWVSTGVKAQGAKGEPGSGAENAVQFTPQALTDNQKAQARENIGATKLPNPSALTFAGAPARTYDGSAPLSVNIAEASQRIVSISDFETFNPSSSLVDSETGATFTLKEGESCQFKAAYNANGKPWMGSGTLGATNNSLSSIYYWSGNVTRLYSTYYMVTAYGSSTTTGQPNMATRVYYGSSRYDWIIESDYSSRSTSGYMKLPSGVMIQWGLYTNSTTAASNTISFPVSFAFTPYIGVTTCSGVNATTDTVETAAVTDMTASNLTMSRRWVQASNAGRSGMGFYWIAIGTWK